jgi:hypothetical protein
MQSVKMSAYHETLVAGRARSSQDGGPIVMAVVSAIWVTRAGRQVVGQARTDARGGFELLVRTPIPRQGERPTLHVDVSKQAKVIGRSEDFRTGVDNRVQMDVQCTGPATSAPRPDPMRREGASAVRTALETAQRAARDPRFANYVVGVIQRATGMNRAGATRTLENALASAARLAWSPQAQWELSTLMDRGGGPRGPVTYSADQSGGAGPGGRGGTSGQPGTPAGPGDPDNDGRDQPDREGKILHGGLVDYGNEGWKWVWQWWETKDQLNQELTQFKLNNPHFGSTDFGPPLRFDGKLGTQPPEPGPGPGPGPDGGTTSLSCVDLKLGSPCAGCEALCPPGTICAAVMGADGLMTKQCVPIKQVCPNCVDSDSWETLHAEPECGGCMPAEFCRGTCGSSLLADKLEKCPFTGNPSEPVGFIGTLTQCLATPGCKFEPFQAGCKPQKDS